MNAEKTNSGEIISISIAEKPLEIGGNKRSLTKYFGEKDISICKGDKIIILGENASGKTRLVKNIHDKISSRIDEEELRNYKIEYIGHRVFETFKEVNEEKLIPLNGREAQRNALKKMRESLVNQIEKNKSDGIETIFIFNINTGLTKTLEMEMITSLDATVVHNMIFSQVHRTVKKLVEKHNKIILLKKTNDITLKKLIFEENVLLTRPEESEILSEIYHFKAMKDHQKIRRYMEDFKHLSFNLIDIKLNSKTYEKIHTKAIVDVLDTISNIYRYNNQRETEENRFIEEIKKLRVQILQHGYTKEYDHLIGIYITKLTEEINENFQMLHLWDDNNNKNNDIKLTLINSNKTIKLFLQELNEKNTHLIEEELVLSSKIKVLEQTLEHSLLEQSVIESKDSKSLGKDRELNDRQDMITLQIQRLKKKLEEFELQSTVLHESRQRKGGSHLQSLVDKFRQSSIPLSFSDISDSQNKSKLKSIETSLALVLCDIDEKNIKSTKAVKELALHYSNIFSASKGKKKNGINVVIRYQQALARKDIIGTIFSISDATIDLRKMQRTGEIGHVNAIIEQKEEGAFEARISISTDLYQKVNKEIESRLLRIMQINGLAVEVKIDQRIGLNKKIIVVNTVEKFLQYSWNTNNEKNTTIIFSKIINENGRKSLTAILNATDILIIDCDGELRRKEITQILNNCRKDGTSVHGHFLFIEINNTLINNSLKNHPFNGWIKSLRRNSETSSQALSAGLREIIKYRHSRNGTISKQDTKRANFIQVEEIISGYDFLEDNERYDDLEFYDSHNFICLNSEIVDIIEIMLGKSDNISILKPQKGMLKILKKVDNEISNNEWREARYSLRKLEGEIEDFDDNSSVINPFKKIEIFRLLEDLMLLCNYLNNGRTNNLFSKEDIGQYKLDVKNIINSNFYQLKEYPPPDGKTRREVDNERDLLISKYDEMNLILPNLFISQLIAIESEKLQEILTDTEKDKMISSLMNNKVMSTEKLKTSWGRNNWERRVRVKSTTYGNYGKKNRGFKPGSKLRSETIYHKKFSPFIGLKHDQIDFNFNDENNWEPKLEWKISHIKQVSNNRSIDERNLHLAEFWALLLDEDKMDRVWEMIEITPKGWMFSVLMRLYNSEIIELPNVISEDIYSVIEKWILEYPWDISDLINTINIFPEPKLNKLYLRELKRTDFDKNKEDYKELWKKDKETEKSLKEWHESIIRKLEVI